MGRAIIMGGTGVIGSAVARRLLTAGWDVELCARNPSGVPADLSAAGASFTAVDRTDARAVGQVLSAGADLLVDCLAYTSDDVGLVLPHLAGIGSTVVLSSKAVYVDAEGRHVNSEGGPRFPGPIQENNPVMAPGYGDYRTREGYGANKVAAEEAYLGSGQPVTVVRASKVHGVGALPAREWYFVRRILEGRRSVLLRAPDSVDHTTAAANIAALVEVVAAQPGRRILNCADPDAPSVAEICRVIADRLDHRWREESVPPSAPQDLGRTPWDAPAPIILDMARARALGYTPDGTYAATVAPTIDWLVAEAQAQGITSVQRTGFFDGLFDYAAEDRFLAAGR
jgi:nucleoside-diphosphate-sugar epimerase